MVIFHAGPSMKTRFQSTLGNATSKRLSVTLSCDIGMKLVPNSRYGGMAGGTSAILDAVLQDTETIAFDEDSVTSRTIGIFPVADMPWKISGIDVAKTGGSPNFTRIRESADRGVFGVGQFVVVVEGRDMPGNIWRNAREESSDVSELLLRIVEPRNN